MIKKLIAVGLSAIMCTSIVYGAEKKEEKILTLEKAIELAIKNNVDLKNLDTQKDKAQSGIDDYFDAVTNPGLYVPGYENMLAQVEYGGAQSFLARDKISRGIILTTETVKNSVESCFSAVTNKSKELQAIREKVAYEYGLLGIEKKKLELGLISQYDMNLKMQELNQLQEQIQTKTTELEIARDELNNLLQLPDLDQYKIEEYLLEYKPLEMDESQLETYINKVLNYDMNVLNKKDEVDMNYEQMTNILRLEGSDRPYWAIKNDAYLAEYDAMKIEQDCKYAVEEKYNMLSQLEAGIDILQANVDLLEIQLRDSKARYELGLTSKTTIDEMEMQLKDLKNQLTTQKANYMDLKRVFQNPYMAGMSMEE